MKVTKSYLKEVIKEELSRLNEAPKSSPEFTKALTDLVGLTKAALDGGMARFTIGHNPDESAEVLKKIMIPWVVRNYDYLESNSLSFGEANQGLAALIGPDGKKKFRPEFAKFFGKDVTPEAKVKAFKVRDTIKNTLLGGLIINGSRGFYKLHIYAIGEVLGMNPPQLKARTPQDQEYLDQDKERFKQQYADIIKAVAGSK
jgi:hypothetical protein